MFLAQRKVRIRVRVRVKVGVNISGFFTGANAIESPFDINHPLL